MTDVRSRRLHRIVRQQFDFSCGSAALATLLTYHYGMPINEAEISQEMIARGDEAQIRSAGFSLLDMRSFLARRGLRAEGVRLPLDKLAEAGVPAVALVDTNGYRHFVLLRGISSATPTQASLSSFDVAGGKRLSADEFRRLAADKTLDRRMPNGARLLVHVAADGAQRLKRQGMNGQTATDRGRVAYRGDQVCSNWERINPGQEICFVYFQLGQDLVAIDLAGAMAPTRLNLPRGNPERV